MQTLNRTVITMGTKRREYHHILLVILLCLVPLLNGCYLFKQGRYLLRYHRSARPVSHLLASDTLNDSMRQFLLLTRQIKQFAVDSIGLDTNENYTSLVYTPDSMRSLVHVVNGARPDTFEQKMWGFPFFGSFPYKGYYEKPDALKEARKLQKKGWETWVRPAGAFSTLGILTDPLYGYMRYYSPFHLASMLIHEQTHATIFLKDNVSFNEQLAVFTGDEGALWFLRSTYGDTSAIYLSALAWQRDYARYLEILRTWYARLDTLYSQPLPAEKILTQKAFLIDSMQTRFAQTYDTSFETGHFKRLAERKVNNAYLMAKMTYTRNLDPFYRLYARQNHDLFATIEQLLPLTEYDGRPQDYLDSLIELP